MSCINQIYFLLQNHLISSVVKQMSTCGALWVIHSPSGKLIKMYCVFFKYGFNVLDMIWTCFAGHEFNVLDRIWDLRSFYITLHSEV